MAVRRAPKPRGCPEACCRPKEALKYALKEALRPARGPEKPWKSLLDALGSLEKALGGGSAGGGTTKYVHIA